MEGYGPVQIFLHMIWEEFFDRHGEILLRLSCLSRDPFRWHNVLQSLIHGSTWPGTAAGFVNLCTALLHQSGGRGCSSGCDFCGENSSFQAVCHSVFTALNYPSPKRQNGQNKFVQRFTKFIVSLCIDKDSPIRASLQEWVYTEDCCLISQLPPFENMPREFFFEKYRAVFSQSETTPNVTPTEFLIVLMAKCWEASVVQGGSRFDQIMLEDLVNVVDNAGVVDIATVSNAYSCSQISLHTVEVIKHTLRVVFLPVDLWSRPPTPLCVDEGLMRCTEFMEPSVLLSVLKCMLSAPNAIPPLNGTNESKFDYSVTNVVVDQFDISMFISCRCIHMFM